MSFYSQVPRFVARTNLKWLWLLVPAAVIVASLRSYFVLQLLSIILIFVVLFTILAALAAVSVFLLLAVGHISEWAAVKLASVERFVTSSLRDTGRLSARASVVAHAGTGRGTRHAP